MINPYTPAIYKLKHDNKVGYYLNYHQARFEILGKNYGKLDEHVGIVWTRFQSRTRNLGVMLTGERGSGKSRVGEILGNLGIDSGMCVLLVTDVVIRPDMVSFLENLHNMVIVFDEFSKNFDMKIQNKMLSMFSSISPYRKLFIITENDIRTVSPYIRTRPGRMLYSLNYDRVGEDVIIAYTNDHGVSEEFMLELMKLYQQAPKFTFDHLQALVSEHHELPNYSMADLLEILNLDELVKEKIWVITKITKLSDNSIWSEASTPLNLDKESLSSKYLNQWVRIVEVLPKTEVNEDEPRVYPKEESLSLTVRKLKEVLKDETYIYIDNGFEVRFSLME